MFLLGKMVVFPCFYWGEWWSTKGSTGIVMVSEAMTNHGVTGHKPSPNWGCLLGICIRLFGMAFKWLLDMICFGICDVWICMISYWGLGSYWPALVRWHMLVLYWNWKMPQFVDGWITVLQQSSFARLQYWRAPSYWFGACVQVSHRANPRNHPWLGFILHHPTN